MNISFIPLAQEHFPLLLKWLQTLHVREWWDGDIDWTPNLIVEKFGKYVPGHKSSKGKESTKAYIICADYKPIGYIQYYNVHDFPRDDQLSLRGASATKPSLRALAMGEAISGDKHVHSPEIASSPAASRNDDVGHLAPRNENFNLPASCAGLDFYIGESDYLRKGIGVKSLEIFLKEYIFPEFDSVFVDPDEKNLAAIRCYEKVGFEWFDILEDNPWMLIYKTPIRLSVRYRVIIEALFRKHFLKRDSLWIFGSRTDMTRRGGDIDLYIETYISDIGKAMDKKSSFWWGLQKELDEQRIDVVLNIIPVERESPLLIYQVAKTEGIKIV